MGYFEAFFEGKPGTGNRPNRQGELEVICPIHGGGSAHVNLEKRVFHCKNPSCDAGPRGGLNETQFIMKIENLPQHEAQELRDRMTQADGNAQKWEEYEQAFHNSPHKPAALELLGITDQTARELRLGLTAPDSSIVTFPVFVYGELMDYREYRPDPGVDSETGKKLPKILSRPGATHHIFPFDLWRKDHRPTLLCAGEKDTATARQHGFNAVCFTGGEGSFPRFHTSNFRERNVYIVYDNDEAGRAGARNAAYHLRKVGAVPHIIEEHHPFVSDDGGDIHDFFKEVGDTDAAVYMLQEWIDQAIPFTEEEFKQQREREFPTLSVAEVFDAYNANRQVSSVVQFVVEDYEAHRVPRRAHITVFGIEDGERMKLREVTWELQKPEQVLEFIYRGRANVQTVLLRLAGLPTGNTKYQYHVREEAHTTVYKGVVVDYRESTEIRKGVPGPKELSVVLLDRPYDSSKKYRIYYRAAIRPDNLVVCGVITEMEEADSSVDSFRATPEVMESLKCFQGDPSAKMEEAFERARAFCGPATPRNVFNLTELYYHSPLHIRFPNQGTIKAALDVMMVGDPRTGKSSTSKAMQTKYGLGSIISLKTATKEGIVGGTDMKHHRTRLGALPRNHGGAVVFEEFSDAGPDFIKHLTYVRSEGEISITRVAGETRADCVVRMLTISNTRKTRNGRNKVIVNYANGVQVVNDLVGAMEDVARYDAFTLVPKSPNRRSQEKVDVQAYDDQAYRNRVCWVWSRRLEQIIIDEETANRVDDQAAQLQQEFDTQEIYLFGPETWKKIIRLATACAACCVSTDETGELLIVRSEHVNWAAQFLRDCYDNRYFKIRDVVTEERKKEMVDEKGITALRDLMTRVPHLLKELAVSSRDHRRGQLQAMSALPPDEFNKIFSRLVACYFLEILEGDEARVTTRFRLIYEKLRSEGHTSYMQRWDAV